MGLNISCLAWDGDRNWSNVGLNTQYINKLFYGLSRHLKTDFDFYVFLDQPEKYDLPKEYNVRQIDTPSWKGCLPKFTVYRNTDIKGRMIMIDLDTVFVGDVTEMFKYDGDFITGRRFRNPNKCGGGVIGFDAETKKWMYDKLRNNKCYIERFTNFGDERIFFMKYLPDYDTWQDLYPDKYYSYKNHIQGNELPEDARIVNFHGNPRPHTLVGKDIEWFDNNWTNLGE